MLYLPLGSLSLSRSFPSAIAVSFFLDQSLARSRDRFMRDGCTFFLPGLMGSSNPRSSIVSFCDKGPDENHSGSSSLWSEYLRLLSLYLVFLLPSLSLPPSSSLPNDLRSPNLLLSSPLRSNLSSRSLFLDCDPLPKPNSGSPGSFSLSQESRMMRPLPIRLVEVVISLTPTKK